MRELRALPLAVILELALAGFLPGTTVEFKFRVQDTALDSPIEGATVSVTLHVFPQGGPGVDWNPSRGEIRTHREVTGPSGAFTWEVNAAGVVLVGVRAPGYFLANGNEHGDIVFAEVSRADLSKDHVIVDVPLRMARTTPVRGKVIDDETKRPLAGIRVRPLCTAIVRGRARVEFDDTRLTETNAKGEFQLERMTCEPYFLSFEPPDAQFSWRAVKNARPESVLVTHRAYETKKWPVEPISPRDWQDGLFLANTELGTIGLRNVPLHTALISIEPSPCEPAEEYFFSLIRAREPHGGGVPCGQQILVENLGEGTYTAVGLLDREPDETQPMFYTKLTIAENEVLTVAPENPIPVRGVLAVEGSDPAVPLPAGLRATSVRFDGPYSPPRVCQIDAKGQFTAYLFRSESYGASAYHADPNYYLKKLIYNGADVSLRGFQLLPGAPSHSVRVVLSATWSTLSGRVESHEDDSSKLKVVVIEKEPLLETGAFLYSLIDVDVTGRFSTRQKPGAYYVVAVPGPNVDQLQRPDLVGRWLEKAVEVELEAGQETQTKTTIPPFLR